MTRLADPTVDAPSRGWRRAARGVGAVLGGAGGAWLAAQLLVLLWVLRPGNDPLTFDDVATSVAAFGAYAGMAVVLFSPIAALLAAAARRIRGGLAACVLVATTGGVLLELLLATNSLQAAVIGGVYGAACGTAGWFASRWARRSAVGFLLLVGVPAGLWTTALLTVS